MSNPGLDARGTVAVNRFAFGRAIQPLLQLGKMLRRLIFFSGLNQGKDLLLCIAGRLKERAIHLTATEGGAGLSGSRGGVGHKEK